MHGLVIRSRWVEKILKHEKTWEVRGSKTRIRGKIALIRSGSGLVVGTCCLIGVEGPLTSKQLKENGAKTGIPSDEVSSLPYAKTYAWVLKDAKELAVPRPYRHPVGAVVWVKLPDF